MATIDIRRRLRGHSVRAMRTGNKKPASSRWRVSVLKSLAVSYFHVAKHHTIIGAERFHFRVRKGIGWFPLAMAARQTFYIAAFTAIDIRG